MLIKPSNKDSAPADSTPADSAPAGPNPVLPLELFDNGDMEPLAEVPWVEIAQRALDGAPVAGVSPPRGCPLPPRSCKSTESTPQRHMHMYMSMSMWMYVAELCNGLGHGCATSRGSCRRSRSLGTGGAA